MDQKKEPLLLSSNYTELVKTTSRNDIERMAYNANTRDNLELVLSILRGRLLHIVDDIMVQSHINGFSRAELDAALVNMSEQIVNLTRGNCTNINYRLVADDFIKVTGLGHEMVFAVIRIVRALVMVWFCRV